MLSSRIIKLCIILILLVSVVYAINTEPDITITEPTDKTRTFNNHIFVNVTANDTVDNENISTFIDYNNSLLSWWRLEKISSTSGDYIDEMNVLHGLGIGTPQLVDGKLGNGYNLGFLGGSGDYGDVTGVEDYINTHEGAMSFWFKMESGHEEDGLLHGFFGVGSGTGTAFRLSIEKNPNDQIEFVYSDFSLDLATVTSIELKNFGGSTFTETVWQHVVGIWNATNISSHQVRMHFLVCLLQE